MKSGHSENEFEISVDLKDMVIGLAYVPKTTVWDALQEIANAALCKIFVDREGQSAYNQFVHEVNE